MGFLKSAKPPGVEEPPPIPQPSDGSILLAGVKQKKAAGSVGALGGTLLAGAKPQGIVNTAGAKTLLGG